MEAQAGLGDRENFNLRCLLENHSILACFLFSGARGARESGREEQAGERSGGNREASPRHGVLTSKSPHAGQLTVGV